jgi:hypothetical protein
MSGKIKLLKLTIMAKSQENAEKIAFEEHNAKEIVQTKEVMRIYEVFATSDLNQDEEEDEED